MVLVVMEKHMLSHSLRVAVAIREVFDDVVDPLCLDVSLCEFE